MECRIQNNGQWFLIYVFEFIVNIYEAYKFVSFYPKNLELCLVWLQSVTKYYGATPILRKNFEFMLH